MLVMDQNQSKAYSRNPMGTETNNGEISNRTVEADTFRSNFEVQSEEGSNKCSQCDFASSRAEVLRTHLQTLTQTPIPMTTMMKKMETKMKTMMRSLNIGDPPSCGDPP